MDRNFYHEDFEQFLKQKADQYKLYPSDRVWNNIYHSQHSRRKWVGAWLVLLLISSSLFTGRQVAVNSYDNIARELSQDIAIAAESPAAKTGFSGEAYAGGQTDRFFGNGAALLERPGSFRNNAVSPFRYSGAKHRSVNPQHAIVNNTAGIAPAEEAAPAGINAGQPADGAADPEINIIVPLTAPLLPLVIAEKKPTGLTQNDNAAVDISEAENRRFSIQLYASPIVSYRRLTNLSNRPAKYVPVAIDYTGNIDSYVRHKPALGFEFGTKAQYKLSSSLSVYTGAQLNYSRYYIDAYNSYAERATIALNSNYYFADTLANYTSIRNFDGASPRQLQNEYFQVSIPLGAELALFEGRRMGLSVAGAIQPTYLINSNSYLISSDYKNYMQNPDLARRFNLHTNVEAFVSYKWGGLKWQLGPQFRYQVLSSYSDKYPIREYLTEFGVKLGLTKTIR